MHKTGWFALALCGFLIVLFGVAWDLAFHTLHAANLVLLAITAFVAHDCWRKLKH